MDLQQLKKSRDNYKQLRRRARAASTEYTKSFFMTPLDEKIQQLVYDHFTPIIDEIEAEIQRIENRHLVINDFTCEKVFNTGYPCSKQCEKCKAD